MTVTVEKTSGFVKLVKKDVRMTRLHKMREEGIFAIDAKGLIQELESLHNVKSIRRVKSDKLVAGLNTNLMDVILENQAFRSRAVEIKIQCFKASKLLEEHIDAARRYLATKYKAQLDLDYGRAAGPKKEAVDYVLEDFVKLERKLDTVIKIADEVVKDLDQAYWTTKSLIDVANLAARRPEI